MHFISVIADRWLGLCRKAPTLRTLPAVLVTEAECAYPAQPDGGGLSGSSGSVRDGIRIAMESLKALVRDRQLLWFMVLSGLAMLFLIAAEGWNITHLEYAMPFLFSIPFGNSFMVIDTRIFLIEAICLSCFLLVLAGLVLHRNDNDIRKPVSIRKRFSAIRPSLCSLAILSVVMAVAGTLLFEIVSQVQFFGTIIFSISMAVFYLPYAYYLPDPISTAIFFSVLIMAVNLLLFLAALYLVPVIVLEKKGLVSALVGSIPLIKRTWREVLGCILVYGLIVLGVFAVALLIGQSPLLLNHDYDFFLQISRGQVLMTVVCYGFIVSCWVLMAAGFTAAGVALSDLYTSGTTGRVPSVVEELQGEPAPA